MVCRELDQEKIDGIDWLVFDPAHRLEAIIQSNALVRGFLGKLERADQRSEAWETK